jgi:hypothetical protein
VVLAACTRPGAGIAGTGAATPAAVYSAGPTLADVRNLLGSSDGGQYYPYFAVGPKVAMLFCSATQQFEAASRACESPFARVVSAWYSNLNR